LISIARHLPERDIRHHLEKDIAHHLHPVKVIHHHLEKDIAHLLPEKDIAHHLPEKDILRNKVRAILPMVENALCLPPINNKFLKSQT
jgi:NifB/MoaA-like Fe-S oxidoreductase